jgi:hypothetical protein
VENLVKSVENLELACGNAVESLGKTQVKNKNCKGESTDFRFEILDLRFCVEQTASVHPDRDFRWQN